MSGHPLVRFVLQAIIPAQVLAHVLFVQLVNIQVLDHQVAALVKQANIHLKGLNPVIFAQEVSILVLELGLV